MRALLGIDVGHTSLAVGLVTPEGDVLDTLEAPMRDRAPGSALETIQRLVEALQARAAVRGLVLEGVGAGLPGAVDAEAGAMRPGIHRMPELAGIPLADRLRAITGVPAFVDNDVNALALAEWSFGLGRGAASLVLLAIGTGVGGGIVLDGHLVRGRSGYGGELGHVPVELAGRRCLCGHRGCLGAYVAGYGIAEEARRRGLWADAGPPAADPAGYDTDALRVFQAAAAGDPGARALVEEACLALGAAIGGLLNGLNPEVLVVTGGIVKSLVACEARILQHVHEHAFPETVADARLHLVPGHKHQTVRGGAALVLYELARRGAPPRILAEG
jgi:glucokinase